MADWKVVVTDYGFPNLDQEKEILEPLGIRLVSGQCRTEEETAQLCAGADAVLTQWAPISRKVIEALTSCKVIVRYGIGVDNVDVDAARERKIPVVNVPDYAINEVADHALSLLLASVRKIPRIVDQVKQGIWNIAPCPPIMGLEGKTLGLAGFGNIARAVAKRAQAFGLNIVAFDPKLAPNVFKEASVVQVHWHQLLEQSDILSVHLPLTKETHHLFNRDAFSRMKSTAYLVNTSRGGVVHTEALIEALEQGSITGAALDVLEQEPIQANSRLLQFENVMVTSHCAWYSESSLRRLQEYAAMEVKRVFSGEMPKHVVDGT